MVGNRFEEIESRLQTLEQFLNGTVLRNKTVSKSGKSSAVIFVPKFFLGQRVKVAITPETTEILGLIKSIDKRDKKIHKVIEENKRLKSTETEKVDESDVVETEDLEEDNAY